MRYPKIMYICFERLYGKHEAKNVEKTKKAAKEFCRTSNIMPGSGHWYYVKYLAKG